MHARSHPRTIMALSYASLVIIAVSIGSFTYGFNFGTPSNIIGFPAFVKYFDVDLAGPDPKHAASMQGGETWLVVRA